MARSAKPRKQKTNKQSSRSVPRLQWRVIPCTGGADNEAGLFFPDFGAAADYCMEKDIPYLFEEDVTGIRETTVWIVGEIDGNVTMTPMSWKNFLSVCTIYPFICPVCNSHHLPPV
ncbi:transposase [Escherichia coli]|uniref:transposase n=1 Tax=Escherichia coli TaxID=562 RepID=UPI002157D0DC|nr:transposase [Escherichia coli]